MPKLTAEEIAAKDAARLNELGYKQVISYLAHHVLEPLVKDLFAPPPGTQTRTFGNVYPAGSAIATSRSLMTNLTRYPTVNWKLWCSFECCLYLVWIDFSLLLWIDHWWSGKRVSLRFITLVSTFLVANSISIIPRLQWHGTAKLKPLHILVSIIITTDTF